METDAKLAFDTSNGVTVQTTFDEMGLREDLLRGIYAYGLEKPSAIQQRAIKPLIMMRDTIAQAQSGTGKTATFTIGETHRESEGNGIPPRAHVQSSIRAHAQRTQRTTHTHTHTHTHTTTLYVFVSGGCLS